MPAVSNKTHFIAWSTDAKDVKMLLKIASPVNNIINDQLTLNLVDICFVVML